MIKLNQPATITITVNDVEDGASATIEYLKPDGTSDSWDATLDVEAETVSYDIPADTLDVPGQWAFIPVVTMTDSSVIPGTAIRETIRARFD